MPFCPIMRHYSKGTFESLAARVFCLIEQPAGRDVTELGYHAVTGFGFLFLRSISYFLLKFQIYQIKEHDLVKILKQSTS